jgi:drug/metabolite transporter (DMT)-like permease
MAQCFSMFLGGLIISFIALLLLPRHVAGTVPSGEVIAFAAPWVLAIALVVFIPSNLIAIWGARTLSPGFVGMLFPLEIVVGTASSALFSDEPFGARQALGSSLIILATLIEGFGQRFQRLTAPQAS